MRLIRDDSEFIRASMDAIKEHLILGGILAALVVTVGLGLAGTLVALNQKPAPVLRNL